MRGAPGSGGGGPPFLLPAGRVSGSGAAPEGNMPVGKTHEGYPSINSDEFSSADYDSRKTGYPFRLQ